MSLYTWLKNWWNNIESPNNKYGWKRDIPDIRDHLFVGDVMPVQIIPETVDLRPKCPAIYNQGPLGSCTGNGIAGLIEFMRMKEGLAPWTPSRLFIYYNERVMEGTVNTDAGAMIRDGIKSVNTQGAPPESAWVYDVNKFTWKPSGDVYVLAAQHPAVQYKRIINTRAELMRLCLSNGIPFTFGFTVYESFESQTVAQTGVMSMPQAGEKILGGHCVDCVGYLPIGALVPGKRHYICRNSWGDQWGDHGYFYMPEEYLTNPNLCADFWAIQLVK